MSHHEFALCLETLNHQNLQLLQRIDYLEERLSMYENVPTLKETSVVSCDEKTCVQPAAADEWNVWPYSWATAAWQTTTERFHSFHENRRIVREEKPSAHSGHGFRQASCDDAELMLM